MLPSSVFFAHCIITYMNWVFFYHVYRWGILSPDDLGVYILISYFKTKNYKNANILLNTVAADFIKLHLTVQGSTAVLPWAGTSPSWVPGALFSLESLPITCSCTASFSQHMRELRCIVPQPPGIWRFPRCHMWGGEQSGQNLPF